MGAGEQGRKGRRQVEEERAKRTCSGRELAGWDDDEEARWRQPEQGQQLALEKGKEEEQGENGMRRLGNNAAVAPPTEG